jgi:sugar phosphate isomerase/epimerase
MDRRRGCIHEAKEWTMQFIFSTGSLYTYGTDRGFEMAARAGFDGVEVMCDQRWDTRQPEHLLQLMDRYAIPVVAVHSPFFGVPGWPQDQPSLITRSLQVAEAVGAQVVVHHLPERCAYAVWQVGDKRSLLPLLWWDRHRGYRQWLLGEYAQVQARTQVRLCIENMPAKQMLGRLASFNTWNTVDEIQRFPALTMDTTHLGTWGIEPVEAYRQWRSRVYHVHLSNFNGREHRRPEDGHLRLDRLLSELAADGYAGAVSLELHPDALEAGRADERVLELLRASLAVCREWAAAHPAAGAAVVAPEVVRV